MEVSSLSAKARQDSEGLDDIQYLKKLTEIFVSRAAQYTWKSYALLGEYTNGTGLVPESQFTPLDYTHAEEKAWDTFNSFGRFRRILQIVSEIDASEFEGGMDQKVKWQSDLNKILNAYREWFTKISEDPTDESEVQVSETVPSMLRRIVNSGIPHVMLYEHGDFQGRALKFNIHYDTCEDFPTDFNDIITSIRLTKLSGICTFYAHSACNGQAYGMAVLENNNLLKDGDFNNMLSSIICLRPDFKAYYRGRMTEFARRLDSSENAPPGLFGQLMELIYPP
ncbi:hypothetical protein CDD82_3685 [Ophiocordyceps australis]|uniref:Beta/gamma crystallin 'Greek key' domain-containing protein n=1 Tax=Ophiocordyceps australis TaxID=1399860 RepID=A0A2C5Z7R1_9HYPO|nr:hypothetical protein CDD82_3685 [Ophiocordyceps australis]